VSSFVSDGTVFIMGLRLFREWTDDRYGMFDAGKLERSAVGAPTSLRVVNAIHSPGDRSRSAAFMILN
jgi:hypothetical protein